MFAIVLLHAKPTETFFWSRAILLTNFWKEHLHVVCFLYARRHFNFTYKHDIWRRTTTQKPSIAGLGPRSVVGRKGKSWGETEKKQTKTKQQKGKQSEPSGRLRRGKGPNPPPQTPARLASLACFLSLSPHCRTCSYFHSTTQHVAVTLIPHKWFTQTLCGCRLFTHLELVSKTTTLHVNNAFFLCIHFPSLHDCNVKIPNSSFYRRHKQARTRFSIISELRYGC